MFNKDVSDKLKIPSLQGLESENNKKFFSITLTILALSFFGFFAIRPTISTIAKLEKEIKDNEFVLSEQEAKITSLRQLETQYGKLGNSIQVVTNAVTVKPEVTLLMGQIQTLCENSNINIKTVQSDEVLIVQTDKEEKYYPFTFEVTGTGSSGDIYKLAQRITNIERVLKINSFTLSYVKDQSEGVLQATIEGTAYYMK
jgi:Tfp pilus assembly protein PilO